MHGGTDSARGGRGLPRPPARSARQGRDDAVSDVVGNVIMTGVTAAMMAGVFLLFLAIPGPNDVVHAELAAVMDAGPDGVWDTGDERLGLRHLGGEPLDRARTSVAFLLDGTPHRVQGDALGGAFAGDGRLTLGETWTETFRISNTTAVDVGVLGGDTVVSVGQPVVERIETSQFPQAPSLSGTTGPGTVVLSWTTPGAGASPITGYNVYRGTDPGTLVNVASLGLTNLYTDGNGNVTNGVTYYYRVAARNALGEGERSAVLALTPLLAGASAPTVSLAAGNLQITVSWSTPADGGSPITGYRLYRGVGAPGISSPYQDLGVQNAFVDSGLTRNQAYYYRVAALTAAGEGALSAEVGITAGTLPAMPTTLTAAHQGNPNSGTIRLDWTAPVDNGGLAVTGYKVYRGLGTGVPTCDAALVATVGAVLTTNDTGLARGQVYCYRVSAVNAAGEGPLSVVASATG